MAIHVNTSDPKELLNSIYAAIDLGSIDAWAYDEEKDFFHQGHWKGEAWLRPTLKQGALVLDIIPPTVGLSAEADQVYHRRFIEMLRTHFEDKVAGARALDSQVPLIRRATMTECPRCEGSGGVQCERCVGKGAVLSPAKWIDIYRDDPGGPLTEVQENCPACYGLGETGCPTCQATGKV
jgi:hypothetical protein